MMKASEKAATWSMLMSTATSATLPRMAPESPGPETLTQAKEQKTTDNTQVIIMQNKKSQHRPQKHNNHNLNMAWI